MQMAFICSHRNVSDLKVKLIPKKGKKSKQTISLNKLSNANVIAMKALGFEGVIVKLEDCIQQYPALVDKANQHKSLEILGSDFDEIEKKQVKEVLGIDFTDDGCSDQALCNICD